MSGVPLPNLLKKVVNPSTRGRPIVDQPVLLWETPGQTAKVVVVTETGTESDRLKGRPPEVYELKKSAHNAFAMGITVGRTPNNDITLGLRSVSRFHAYFLHDESADTWSLVDAESKLGTFISGTRLAPNVPTIVPDRARVRFGSAELIFLSPDAFLIFAANWRPD